MTRLMLIRPNVHFEKDMIKIFVWLAAQPYFTTSSKACTILALPPNDIVTSIHTKFLLL